MLIIIDAQKVSRFSVIYYSNRCDNWERDNKRGIGWAAKAIDN